METKRTSVKSLEPCCESPNHNVAHIIIVQCFPKPKQLVVRDVHTLLFMGNPCLFEYDLGDIYPDEDVLIPLHFA